MKIIVFQQFGSAEKKIAGMRKYGHDISKIELISIDIELPELVDEPEEFVTDNFQADLVLNYLKHPDLSEYLINICEKKSVPVVSSGKKGTGFTPFTCCGLGKNEKLGVYGSKFGLPEYKVHVRDGKIIELEVLRGAPCGATWDSIGDIIGMDVEEALTTLPRRIQYFCVADPSGFDPVSGKSPVHYAGHVHIAALKKALSEIGDG